MSHTNGIPYVRKIYDNGDSKKKIEKTTIEAAVSAKNVGKR